MKARTIGIVAAAGLAALVGGCKENQKDTNPKIPPMGIIYANAPACNYMPTVDLFANGYKISCGRYNYSMIPGSILDSNGNYMQRVCGTLKEDGRDYMQIWEDNECDGTAERWLNYAWDSKEQKFNLIEQSNIPPSQEGYRNALQAIGAKDVEAQWKSSGYCAIEWPEENL